MRFLLVCFLLALATVSVSAGNLVVGSYVDNDKAEMTVLTYASEKPDPTCKFSGTQLLLGYAQNVTTWKQDVEAQNAFAGAGIYLTNGFTKVSAGFTGNYVNSDCDDGFRMGYYGAVDLMVSKCWFVQAKYNQIWDADLGKGWQIGAGIKF